MTEPTTTTATEPATQPEDDAPAKLGRPVKLDSKSPMRCRLPEGLAVPIKEELITTAGLHRPMPAMDVAGIVLASQLGRYRKLVEDYFARQGK